MYEDSSSNDLQEIITQAIEDIKKEQGDSFDLEHLNLAELGRRTGLSRGKLRTIQENGFIVKPHGRTGMHSVTTVLSGYTGVVDEYLRKGVCNSEVIFPKLCDNGYKGSKSTLKKYIAQHKEDPGESYQMDWGFVHVDTADGDSFRVACFAMICHHCGKRYVEFFPNAKQENLFIGMIHAFTYLGVPERVLTDNMKSVVIGRDPEGHPIWQKDYESFMKTVGFRTVLCKPRHPFTKGAVERLIRFVKENFLADRTCTNVTELNFEALAWCEEQNSRYHRAVDCIPNDAHAKLCMERACILTMTQELYFYLCPERKISFDGFVNYEGRRFGVPYSYQQRVCRVMRDRFTIFIYSADLSMLLTEHDVTWSRRDSFCKDQYVRHQPEELPTSPISVSIHQITPPKAESGFDKFNFEEGLWDE